MISKLHPQLTDKKPKSKQKTKRFHCHAKVSSPQILWLAFWGLIYKILHGSVVSWKNITSPHRAHRKGSFLRNTASKGEFTQRMDIELSTFSRVNTLSSYWREASGLLNSLIVSKFLRNWNGLAVTLATEEKLPGLQGGDEREGESLEDLVSEQVAKSSF